jgi:hypothetical protein
MRVSAGGGGLKDVGIYALFPQQAFRAFFGTQRADDLFEGVPEAAAEGRSFVLRKSQAIDRFENEYEGS